MQRTYHLEPNQWISDCSVVDDVLSSGNNTIISAPPGSGRTHAIVTALQKAGRPFVYLASVKPLADEIGERYNLPVFHAGTEYASGPQVVTIPFHLDSFSGTGMVLVWDELSWFVGDYGFRPESLEQVSPYLMGNGFSQVIVLESGPMWPGDPWNFDIPGLQRVKVYQERESTPIDWVEYQDLKTVLLDSIAAYPDRTHFVSLFNKKDLADDIASMLTDNGLVEIEVSKYNSEVGDREGTVAVLAGELRGSKIRVVLSTYRLGFSVDRGSHVLHIVPYMLARHSAVDIMQLVGRFRDGSEAPLIRLYYRFPETPMKTIHLNWYEAELRNIAERRIREYKKVFGPEPDSLRRDYIKHLERSDINGNQRNGLCNLVRPNLRVNYWQIRHNVVNKYTESMYSSPGFMAETLANYGLSLRRGEHHGRIAEVRKVSRARLSEEELEKIGDDIIVGRNGGLDETGALFVFLRQLFSDEHACTLFKQYGKTSASRSRLLNLIHAQKPETELEDALRQDMYDTFEVGEELTSEEIQHRMNLLNQRHFITRGSVLSQHKATQALNKYFVTTRKRTRKEDASHLIVIQSDWPLVYPMKGMNRRAQIVST